MYFTSTRYKFNIILCIKKWTFDFFFVIRHIYYVTSNVLVLLYLQKQKKIPVSLTQLWRHPIKSALLVLYFYIHHSTLSHMLLSFFHRSVLFYYSLEKWILGSFSHDTVFCAIICYQLRLLNVVWYSACLNPLEISLAILVKLQLNASESTIFFHFIFFPLDRLSLTVLCFSAIHFIDCNL